MTLTQSRTIQYLGIILVALALAVGYWYFSVRAGVRTNTSLSQPAGIGRLDSGLSAYYALDAASGSSATDSSTNGNTGTLTNMESPTDWVAAQVGNGLDFDGVDEYVTVADTALQDYGDTESFTISGWFNRDTFTTDDTIIAKRNGITAADAGYLCYIDDATDQLICEISDGTDEYSVTSSSTFTATGWNHFAFVWDQASATATNLYINGVSNNPTKSGTIGNIGDLSNAVAFRLGAESDAGNPYDGKLDEMRVYNRPLLPDEISELYRLTATTGIDTGLKGYWSFDGGSMATTTTMRDLSGARNTGTLSGGPTATRGIVGQALSFDGTDDYVSIADTSSLDITAAISMGAWIKTTDTSDSCIISKSSAGPDKCFNSSGTKTYELGIFSSALYFQTSNGTTTNAVSVSSTGLTDGVWHHIMATWDGTTATNAMKIYIDGAVSAQGTATVTSIQNSAATLNFGGDGGLGDYGGVLDEVRLYNRALSSTEVQALYQLSEWDKVSASASQPQGTGRLDSGLSAYYALDEASGTSATDASTNANTGTLTNMETPTDWVAAQVGNGLDFDGVDEYVTVADTATQDYGDTESFTITGWFNRDTFTTDDTIIAKRNGITAADTGYLCYISAADQLICEVSDGTDEYSVTSTSTFTAAGWNHFAFVWDQVSATATDLSINGVSNNPTKSGTIGNVGDLSNAVAFRLGAESDAGNPYDGKLDEMRIYNRPLSSNEIGQLYRLTAPTGVDTGLKGYWSFNAGDMASSTITRDLSGGRSAGTLTGNTGKTIGRVGQGFSFDGTGDYVDLGNTLALSLPITVSAWVNPSALPGTYAGIFTTDKTQTSAHSYSGMWLSVNSSGTLDASYGDNTACTSSGRRTKTSTGTLVTNVWQHVTAVINGATDMQIYINGVDVGGTYDGTGGSIIYTSNNAAIGRITECTDGSGRDFNGKIDEPRIYNRALTAAEAKGLYESGNPDLRNSSASQPQGSGRLDGGLVGYWQLDETTGSSASDSSTNGNTGTLTNMENGDWTTGRIGNGLTFDGTNESIVTSSNLNLKPDKFTYSMWMYSTAVPDIPEMIFVPDYSDSGWDWGWGVFMETTGDIVVRWADGSNPNAGEINSITNNFTNTWHLITVTFNGTTISLYIDGVLEDSDNASVLTYDPVTADGVTIGGGGNFGLDGFTGILDEIRLYNYAFSSDQVAQLFRLATTTSPDTGLKGYWSFNGPDMVSSTIARDLSGAGYSGTLTNSPTKTVGKLGQALNFASASTQYVNIGTGIPDSANTSACAWVKPSTALTTSGDILARATVTPAGWILGLDFTTLSSLRLGWYRSFNGTDGYWLTQQAIPYSEWTHVCATYNNSATTNDPVLYVNGAVATVIENQTPTGATDTGGNVAIGAFYDGSSGAQELFNGAIDELRVYSRILTAAEVKMLYDASR